MRLLLHNAWRKFNSAVPRIISSDRPIDLFFVLFYSSVAFLVKVDLSPVKAFTDPKPTPLLPAFGVSLLAGMLITICQRQALLLQRLEETLDKFDDLKDVGTLFRLFERAGSLELSEMVRKRMRALVWNISGVGIDTAYYYLSLFLDKADTWEGIHCDVPEKLKFADDAERNKYLRTLSEFSVQKSARRILILDDAYFSDVLSGFETGGKKEERTDVFKAIWISTAERVPTFIACGRSATEFVRRKGFRWKVKEDTQRRLAKRVETNWTDCALYDREILVAFRSMTWLGIWLATREIKDEDEDDKAEIGLLAQATRLLFDELARQRFRNLVVDLGDSGAVESLMKKSVEDSGLTFLQISEQWITGLSAKEVV